MRGCTPPLCPTRGIGQWLDVLNIDMRVYASVVSHTRYQLAISSLRLKLRCRRCADVRVYASVVSPHAASL